MQTTLKRILLPLLATAGLVLTGCLLKDENHSLYLDADGSLTWQVLERNVRSDESDPEQRAAEEREYAEAFSTGNHEVAKGLRALEPDSLDAVWLRDERPYSTMTTARFPAIDALVRDLLYQSEVLGTVEYETSDGEHRLTVCIDLVEGEPIEVDHGVNGEILGLLDDMDSLEIFLTDGVFTEAEGFDLHDDGRSATLTEVDDEQVKEMDTFVLRLVWRADPA